MQTFKITQMKKLIYSLLLVMTVVTVVQCQSMAKGKTAPSSKTFVLVHGAWQAPYVWQTVKSELKKKGCSVIVVELPGHGADTTFPAKISMDAYRDKVISAISPVKGKVILVGHSMAGMVISAVAEAIPDRIEKLVYLGAYVPANGQSLLALASVDKESMLGPNLIPSADKLTLDVKKENLINIFCADGSDNIKSELLANYRAEPAIPFTNAVTLTGDNFGKADKYYIYTLQDHAIGGSLQKQMVAAAGISKTYSLDSSHCPFLSMPSPVTAVLLKIAAN